MSTKRDDFITGLRELADYLEARPALPTPLDGVTVSAGIWSFDGEVDVKAEIAAVARAMGKVEKEADGDYFRLRSPEFSGGVSYYVATERMSVCERVQVGTTTREILDPEHLADVPTVKVEEPVYEWRCEPSLLASAEAGAS